MGPVVVDVDDRLEDLDHSVARGDVHVQNVGPGDFDAVYERETFFENRSLNSQSSLTRSREEIVLSSVGHFHDLIRPQSGGVERSVDDVVENEVVQHLGIGDQVIQVFNRKVHKGRVRRRENRPGSG